MVKKIKLPIMGSVVVCLVAAACAPLVFLNLESNREARLSELRNSSFVPPSFYIEGRFKGGSLLTKAEVLVCASDGYIREKDFARLTELQMRSLTKRRPPGEDGVWYLLFFDADGLTRIHLIESHLLTSAQLIGTGCIKAEESYDVIFNKSIYQIHFGS